MVVGWILALQSSSAAFNSSAARMTFTVQQGQGARQGDINFGQETYSLFCFWENRVTGLTTEVVPSPTSWSWRSANWHRILAAGCSTSNNFKMVAPSLVIVTSWVQQEAECLLRIVDLQHNKRNFHPSVPQCHRQAFCPSQRDRESCEQCSRWKRPPWLQRKQNTNR